MTSYFSTNFLFGFCNGLNNWFCPTLPFMYSFNNLYFNNPFTFNTSWSSMPSFYPIFNSPQTFNYDFLNTNSVWSNYQYQTPDFQWNQKPAEEVNNKAKDKDRERTERPKRRRTSERNTFYSTTRRSNGNGLHSKRVTGKVNHSYIKLSKRDAEARAASDPNLESLSETSKKYSGWTISSNSFKTDIPFAKKGTGRILQEVYEKTGIKLTVTSALGTGEAGNPHSKGNSYNSHHNAENPKLDISLDCTFNGKPKHMSAHEMAQRLWATGLFSHILEEPKTNHLDVQIHPDAFKKLGIIA